MSREFRLPDLGEGLTEAVLLDWKVREGDVVEQDQIIAEIETDKATTELPSRWAGRIVGLYFRPGDVIRVGELLVRYAEEPVEKSRVESREPRAEEELSQLAEMPATEEGERRVAREAAADETPIRRLAGSPARPVLATPATRRRARELGVPLETVPGTGPAGRITTEDVEALARAHEGKKPAEAKVSMDAGREAPLPGPPPSALRPWPLAVPPLPDFRRWGPVRREKLSAVRRRIAARMTLSAHMVATAAHTDEADVTALEALRADAKPRALALGIRLTPLPYCLKAVASALKAFPRFNASYDEEAGDLIVKGYYHVGVAVDSPQGLFLPVVRDVDRKGILELGREIGELAAAVRAGKITLEQLHGGTFSVTNIGSIGGTGFAPLVNWPDVAILGIGRIQPKSVVREGQIVVRTMMPLVFAFDHRVADGAEAARFVNEVKRLLEQPGEWASEQMIQS